MFNWLNELTDAWAEEGVIGFIKLATLIFGVSTIIILVAACVIGPSKESIKCETLGGYWYSGKYSSVCIKKDSVIDVGEKE